MISLDVRTLVFAATLVSGVMSLVMYAVWRKRSDRCLSHWTLGTAALAAGFLLIALRGLVPDFVSIVVANGCVAFGAGCSLAGVNAFLGRPAQWSLIAATTAAAVAALAYFTYAVPDTNARIVIMSVTPAGVLGLAAQRLLSDPDAVTLGAARTFMVATWATYGVYSAARVLVTLGSSPIADFMAAGTTQAAVMLVAMLLVIAQVFGFYALVDSRHLTQLARAKAESDKANAAKSEFLANMSHELRTPLNAIIGFSELMTGGALGPLPAKYREYAHDILLSGNHVLALINDVLDLAKIDAGRVELREHEFDVGESIRRALIMTSGLARSNNVTVETVIDDLPPLLADQLRIEQALVNLVSNAIKFTPGGTVTVTASVTTDALALSVADTGVGMTDDEIRTALTRFGQVGYVHLTKKLDGTGLGLPVTAALVKLHGGTLDIKSTPGAGTTVTVLLPKDRLRAPAPRLAAQAGR